jgi:hypothetical protein
MQRTGIVRGRAVASPATAAGNPTPVGTLPSTRLHDQANLVARHRQQGQGFHRSIPFSPMVAALDQHAHVQVYIAPGIRLQTVCRSNSREIFRVAAHTHSAVRLGAEKEDGTHQNNRGHGLGTGARPPWTARTATTQADFKASSRIERLSCDEQMALLHGRNFATRSRSQWVDRC